jgi:uncharacterized protein YciI
MEFFFYCRDRPGVGELRGRLTEEHWAFMDRFADRLIARGPTFSPDGTAVTGSMHIVDLPDVDAAHEFAFDEPYYKGGVFDEVLVRRWSNTLGHTMWEFTGGVAGHRRFLIIAHGGPGRTAAREALAEEYDRYLARDHREHLIAIGPLMSEDGAEWAGTAMLVELPDRDAVEGLLAEEPCARAGLYESIEIHDWRFGGRPQA